MQISFLTTFAATKILCINEDKFPNLLKQANITPVFKKALEAPRRNIVFRVSYISLLKYFKRFLGSK